MSNQPPADEILALRAQLLKFVVDEVLAKGDTAASLSAQVQASVRETVSSALEASTGTEGSARSAAGSELVEAQLARIDDRLGQMTVLIDKRLGQRLETLASDMKAAQAAQLADMARAISHELGQDLSHALRRELHMRWKAVAPIAPGEAEPPLTMRGGGPPRPDSRKRNDPWNQLLRVIGDRLWLVLVGGVLATVGWMILARTLGWPGAF